MKARTIYLDIETIPGQHESVRAALQLEADAEKTSVRAPSNYKDEAKIAEFIAGKHAEIDAGVDARWRRTSFDGALGQIVCASLAIDDEAPINIYQDEWATAEPYILRELFRVIGDTYTPSSDMRPVFVGHNVVGFDLRFIYQRAVLLGVKPHPIIPFDAKPWGDQVFDTMTKWAGHGKMVSLDKLCRVFGIPTKGAEIGDEIDGSLVWDFVQAGRIADVATYCAGDVERVREIHRRMTFAYQDAA